MMRASYAANDTPEMQEICRNCELPRCINCFERKDAYGWATRFWLLDKYGTEKDMDKYLKPIRRAIWAG